MKFNEWWVDWMWKQRSGLGQEFDPVVYPMMKEAWDAAIANHQDTSNRNYE
jgi:hypothetical protein